jgi:nucleotide-binding universal stress UspA family protein
MKVLLTSDGSECSERAARYLAKSLRKSVQDLEVTLFYVDAPMMDRVAAALGERRVAEIHRENADRCLKAARRLLKRGKVRFDESHTAGNPAQEIARRAKSGGYDLVIMGSHGRSALRNVLLGSVTARVLSVCEVPALVVH